MALSDAQRQAVAAALGVEVSTLKSSRGRKAGTMSAKTAAARTILDSAKPNKAGAFVVQGVTASQVRQWCKATGKTLDYVSDHARYAGSTVFTLKG